MAQSGQPSKAVTGRTPYANFLLTVREGSRTSDSDGRGRPGLVKEEPHQNFAATRLPDVYHKFGGSRPYSVLAAHRNVARLTATFW